MIDSHSHIYMDRFDEDRDGVINRAVQCGVTQLLQVGCNLEESRTVVELAEKHAGIYASVGVHPHDASTVNDDVLDALEGLTSHPKVVSWGEIGLDYYYDNSPRDVQREAFRAQLKRAAALDLPVVIHTRDAEEDTLEIMTETPIARGGHVHCFTGSGELAQKLLEMGYHIGFTGIITFKAAADLREVVRQVPLNRILIETDSPYLAPVPKRGKRNEPEFVQYVAQAVADLKEVTLEELITASSKNFYGLYGKPDFQWEPLATVS